MCSGVFQVILLHIAHLWFAATLTKAKHIVDALTYLKKFSMKRLYDCFKWNKHSLMVSNHRAINQKLGSKN